MRYLLLLLVVGCAPGQIGGIPGAPAGDADQPADPRGIVDDTDGESAAPAADGGLLPDGAATASDPPPPDPDGSAGSADMEWPAEGLLPGIFTHPTHVGLVDDTTVTVSWTSATAAVGTLRYRTGSGAARTVETPAATEHHATLQDLHRGAGYSYEVEVDGAVREGVFVTPGDETVRLVHLGEFHAPGESANAAAFADVLRGFRPHLLVESGDMVDTGEDMNHWTDYLRTSAPWISNAILLPAHSNHVGQGAGIDHMIELFDMPDDRLYYATRYGAITVLTIRSDWFDGRAEQSVWIREQSALAHDGIDDPAFLIAAWHHPACSSNYASRADSREDMMEDLVEPLLEGGGVDLILVGHDKYYERSWIDGEVAHVMTNIGKTSPGEAGNNHPRCTPVTTELTENSTLLIDASPTSLHGRAVGADGTTLDEFTLTR